jgi:hypothetical protein
MKGTRNARPAQAGALAADGKRRFGLVAFSAANRFTLRRKML